jgi:hypothetical protein
MELNQKLGVVAGVVASLMASGRYAYGTNTYTTLDDPLAIPAWTEARGISDNTIVGDYYVGGGSQGEYGFSENGGIYTTLDDPLTGGLSPITVADGVFGSTIVGYYNSETVGNQGFSETNGVYTTLAYPPAYRGGVLPEGIYQSTVVGWYFDPGFHIHGFSETNGIYTTLVVPA